MIQYKLSELSEMRVKVGKGIIDKLSTSGFSFWIKYWSTSY